MFGLSDTEKEEEIECPWCHWKGKKKDLIQRYVNSPPEAWMAMAGREGYEYDCPRRTCRFTLIHDYWKLS